MKIKLLCILLILSWNSFGEQTAEELSKILLDDFEQRATASTLVPETIRSEVIEYVRKVRDRKIYGNGTSAEVLLVNLKDQEHIQQVLTDLLQSENPGTSSQAAGTLRRSSQVEIIPMLADYLYGDDDIYRDDKVREIMLASYSIVSGSISMHILSRSPDVPADVREWAQATVLEKRNGLKLREVMRQWWPKNKQYFETKEYQKLRPLGAEHPPEEPPVPPEKEEAPTPVLQTNAPIISPTKTPPEDKTGVELQTLDDSETPEKTSNSWKFVFPIIGSVIIVLAFALSIFRKNQ